MASKYVVSDDGNPLPVQQDGVRVAAHDVTVISVGNGAHATASLPSTPPPRASTTDATAHVGGGNNAHAIRIHHALVSGNATDSDSDAALTIPMSQRRNQLSSRRADADGQSARGTLRVGISARRSGGFTDGDASAPVSANIASAAVRRTIDHSVSQRSSPSLSAQVSPSHGATLSPSAATSSGNTNALPPASPPPHVVTTRIHVAPALPSSPLNGIRGGHYTVTGQSLLADTATGPTPPASSPESTARFEVKKKTSLALPDGLARAFERINQLGPLEQLQQQQQQQTNMPGALTPQSKGGKGVPAAVGADGITKTGALTPKPVQPNKNKMMALMGEAVPENAFDPTGHEHRDEPKTSRDADDYADPLTAATTDEQDEDLDFTYDPVTGAPHRRSLWSRLTVRIRRRARLLWRVSDPASSGRQYWSLLVVCFLLYGMIEIPIRVGFEYDVAAWGAADLFNLFVDLFFLTDVVMNFRTGFYQEDNRLVLDERRIALRYLKGWFAIDLLTSIPVSQIAHAASYSTDSALAAVTLPRLLRIIRLSRLVKILRMLKLLHVMSNWSESANAQLFSLGMKVLKFLTMIFLLTHWSGCIWGYIAIQSMSVDGSFAEHSWPFAYGVYNYYDVPFSNFYLLTIYWATTTLGTVGYGDIHAVSATERTFCIILTFVGTLVFSYITGTISSILKHGKESELLYSKKMTELNLYMQYRKISPFLQRKIRGHYDYLYRKKTLYNEVEILAELPSYLRSDLSIYLYRDLIAKVPFLADMGPDCSMLVILKLKPLHAIPGEYIYTIGASGREMFFVSKGAVQVIDTNGYIVAQLTAGSYFGEYAILSEKPVYRTASVRARLYTDLFSLSKKDFEVIWTLYPEIYAKIILKAKEQWEEAIRRVKDKREKERAEKGGSGGSGGSSGGGGSGSGGSNAKEVTKPVDASRDATSPKSIRTFTKKTSMSITQRQDLVGTSGGGSGGGSGNTSGSSGGGKDTVIKINTTGADGDKDGGGGGGVGSDTDATTPRDGGRRHRRPHRVRRPAVLAGSEIVNTDALAQTGLIASLTGGSGSGGSGGDNALDDTLDDDVAVDDDASSSSSLGSYVDSLDGLSSGADEVFDPRLDTVDLPPHLLPPPKPRIRGSFVNAAGETTDTLQGIYVHHDHVDAQGDDAIAIASGDKIREGTVAKKVRTFITNRRNSMTKTTMGVSGGTGSGSGGGGGGGNQVSPLQASDGAVRRTSSIHSVSRLHAQTSLPLHRTSSLSRGGRRVSIRAPSALNIQAPLLSMAVGEDDDTMRPVARNRSMHGDSALASPSGAGGRDQTSPSPSPTRRRTGQPSLLPHARRTMTASEAATLPGVVESSVGDDALHPSPASPTDAASRRKSFATRRGSSRFTVDNGSPTSLAAPVGPFGSTMTNAVMSPAEQRHFQRRTLTVERRRSLLLATRWAASGAAAAAGGGGGGGGGAASASVAAPPAAVATTSDSTSIPAGPASPINRPPITTIKEHASFEEQAAAASVGNATVSNASTAAAASGEAVAPNTPSSRLRMSTNSSPDLHSERNTVTMPLVEATLDTKMPLLHSLIHPQHGTAALHVNHAVAASPDVVRAVESLMQTSLQPLREQYSQLTHDYAQLQEKQQRTEQLLSQAVQKLRQDRAKRAAATAQSQVQA